jgi:hypothetical protein
LCRAGRFRALGRFALRAALRRAGFLALAFVAYYFRFLAFFAAGRFFGLGAAGADAGYSVGIGGGDGGGPAGIIGSIIPGPPQPLSEKSCCSTIAVLR